ncbi:hypothetical protein NHQ30_006616 [Ciborinia camelliae]|nr:hypothetical protein NHQ30_006616 [Ciborinia camelliae]
MENDWQFKNWRPTVSEINFKFPSWTPPNRRVVESNRDKLRASAANVLRFPYNPQHWRQRSAALLSLGFPELAASDAFKAITLANFVFDNEELGTRVWFEMGMMECFRDGKDAIEISSTALGLQLLNILKSERKLAYNHLISSLELLRAFQDMKSICSQALKYYPGDLDFKSSLQHANAKYREFSNLMDFVKPDMIKWLTTEMGVVSMRHYPWVPREFRTRSDKVIQVANENLSKCSRVLTLQPSPMNTMPPESGVISYGVFATKDIKAGETVLATKPALCVTGSQMDGERGSCFNCCRKLESSSRKFGFSCCPQLYFCSRECKYIAQNYYHDAQCGVNISEFYEAVKNKNCVLGGPEISNMIWLRLLATCKQGGGNPLQHPLLASLPIEEGTDDLTWSLEARVIGPMRILEKLGIDVFSNKDYDAWVLESVWYVYSESSPI